MNNYDLSDFGSEDPQQQPIPPYEAPPPQIPQGAAGGLTRELDMVDPSIVNFGSPQSPFGHSFMGPEFDQTQQQLSRPMTFDPNDPNFKAMQGLLIQDPAHLPANQIVNQNLYQMAQQRAADALKPPSAWSKGQDIGHKIWTDFAGPAAAAFSGPGYNKGFTESVKSMNEQIKQQKISKDNDVNDSLAALKGLGAIATDGNKDILALMGQHWQQVNAQRAAQQQAMHDMLEAERLRQGADPSSALNQQRLGRAQEYGGANDTKVTVAGINAKGKTDSADINAKGRTDTAGINKDSHLQGIDKQQTGANQRTDTHEKHADSRNTEVIAGSKERNDARITGKHQDVTAQQAGAGSRNAATNQTHVQTANIFNGLAPNTGLPAQPQAQPAAQPEPTDHWHELAKEYDAIKAMPDSREKYQKLVEHNKKKRMLQQQARAVASST